MGTRRGYGAFDGGDPTSRTLVSLAAGEPGKQGGRVSAGLVEFAQRHGLIPILAEHVNDPVVRAIEARESARRAVLNRHLFEVLTLLDGAGVRAAVLKGPAIAARYRTPGLRPYSDIDILVPENQLDQALAQLDEYRGTVHIPDKRPKADKRDVLMKDETGISFNCDLHWDLFSYSQLRSSAHGATEAAWDQAAGVPDSPLGPLWEIPDSFRLAFLASHAVLDHRFRLILFRDFLELLSDPVDWDDLIAVAERWGLRSTTYLALWLSSTMLGASVDAEHLSALRPRSAPIRFLERALPGTDIVRFDGHRPHPVNLAAVLLNDSPRERLSLLVRAPSAFPGWKRRVSTDQSVHDTPRTLIVVSTDKRRGAEVFTERLRSGLLRKGWVVEAVALYGSDGDERADVEALTEGGHESRGRLDWPVLRSLRGKIRTYRPDLIVANGGATLRYSLIANAGNGAKVAYIGIGEPAYWIRSRLSSQVNRFMLRQTDAVLAVSDTTRRQLIELEPLIADRSVTTYTGVPEDLFGGADLDPEGPLRVVMVGSLSDEKDPFLALDAVTRIEGACFRIVGDGPLAGEIRHYINQHELSERVTLVGSVSDVRSHLEWAQVLILTSKSEGLPGAILEAGAAGRVVVAVDVGGVREAVADGESGFVVERDVDQLSAALEMLHSERDLLAKMGRTGRDYVRSRFGLSDTIERYHAALTELGR